MSGFGPHTTSFGDPTVKAPRNRPRVNLPPPPMPVPAPWAGTESNPCCAMPAAPNTVTLDQTFPSLGAPHPRVNLPHDPPMHVQYPSNFEDQMRGMILSNGDQHQRLNSRQNTSFQGSGPDHSTSRRPNQAQRRQPNGQINDRLPSNQSFDGHYTHQTPREQVPVQHLAPHLRGLVQSKQPNRDWRSPGVRADPQQQNNSAAYSPQITPNHTSLAHNQAYNRPPVQQRQLYNPSSNELQSQRQDRYQGQTRAGSAQAQADYLDSIVYQEIPKVEISLEEFAEKEQLRKLLELTCRTAVYEHEKSKKGVNFRADTVELKCFGSMSTTFATKSSDMDLVFVSPSSEPEASSPESELPRIIEKALLDSKYGARLLTKTRVPIIRFCERPTPELATLLLEERAKFESQRDAVPKPPKGKKTKPSQDERSDLTLPQNRLSYVAEAKADLKNSDPIKVAKRPEVSASNGAKAGGNLDGSLRVSPIGGEKPNKNGDGREGKSLDLMDKEGSDPCLLTKTDAERIRLYKLAIKEGWYEPSERKVISNYFQTFVRKDATEEERDRARDHLTDLPNVIGRYRAPPETHLEFPKSGVGIQCDINFSNYLALHNSHMLKCYSLCDSRVRRIVLFVKAWSKKRKINTPYHGTLSSYGYVLMILHYLVNIAQPPVLPNLQRIPQAFDDEISTKEVELEGHNIQFFRNEAAIEELRRHKALTTNYETVGSLLRGFFHYYAQQGYNVPGGGFSWALDTLSLRTVGGIVSKQAKGWTGAKTETIQMKGPGLQQTKEVRQRYLFAIEDPFEIDHNIARTVVHKGIVAIRDEFRRAHKVIEHVGILPGEGPEVLFAEAEDKHNLQYSAFGPRPRKGLGLGNSGKISGNTQTAGNGEVAAAARLTQSVKETGKVVP